MAEMNGLTDSAISMITRCGGTAIGQLTGKIRHSLAERRNALAHGNSIEGFAPACLLELIRDLPTATTSAKPRSPA